jgi:SAM-dependent methyltransferase
MLKAGRAVLGRLRNWQACRPQRQNRASSLVDASVWNAPRRADRPLSTEMHEQGGLDPDLVPILGEFAWHSLTVDARLAAVSADHYGVVSSLIADAGMRRPQELCILEVAAYAHTTGYMLFDRLGARTDLLDISPSTLRLGRRLAAEQGLRTDGTTCVAGDFHDLPYADEQFDLVYICSALHHTWRWERVLAEMVRVLAPGGVLLLENEPCRRLFCHYRFRANRVEQYGALEQALVRLGILRTVAEPFPNTRPETLFGMVENQTIPLAALCGALASSCTPVSVTVNTDVCMEAFDYELLERALADAPACKRWLTGEMTRRIDEAASAMSAVDRGMGFGVPNLDDIGTLCAATVDALATLPTDHACADFRMGVADIFGAQVSLAVRKHGVRDVAPSARLAQQYPVQDGVVCAFPPRVARLLDSSSALLPDIQTSPIAALTAVFSPTDWVLSTTADNLRVLMPARAEPSFVVPVSAPASLLIVVRLYAAVDARPFRVAICTDDREIDGFDAYAAESVLLSPIVQCHDGMTQLRLTIRTRWLGADATADETARVYTVSLATAFAL